MKSPVVSSPLGMKICEALWSAAACCRFPRASLLAPFRPYLRRTTGKPACKKRQQAAALQSASKRLRRTHFHGSGWIHLLGQRAVEGAGVFDLQIIAAMLANAVQRIYTFNPGDFQVFAELTAVTPT
jgi:hypothetical protein